MRAAKMVQLKFRSRLLQQDNRIDAVYFPVTCMVSLLVSSDGQPRMEMATVGREGVVGASEVIQKQGAMSLNLIQIRGAALQIPTDAFLKVLESRPQVQKLIDQHLFALMRQILYGAACNRLHSMEERCARWLLMTHDRAGQDTFR
jgi:CRP-like cAMP-binding protein